MDNIDTSTRAYYESVIEELKTNNKANFKLSLEEIESFCDEVNDSWIKNECYLNDEFKEVLFNKLHEWYGI